MNQHKTLIPRWKPLSAPKGYGLAAVSTGLSALARWMLPLALSPVPYLGFYPAVVVSAALGGVGPGLVSTFASLLLVNIVFGSFNIHDHAAIGRQVIWVVSSIGVSLLAGMQRSARMRERRYAEELQASEERFRAMFEHHKAIMLLIKPESGAIVDANASAAKFYHRSREELCSLNVEDINQMPAGDVATHRRKAAKGQQDQFIFPHLLGTGETRWVEVYSTPIVVEGTSLLFSVIHDITERKQAEEALHTSEEKYRTLFNTLIVGFCIIEVIFDSDNRPVDYRFLEINPAFEAQTGLQNAQGRLMRELAPDLEPHWFEIYGKIALTGEPARFVNEARALNRWYDVSAYRIGSPENRRVAIVFNDITERKRAEEELRESQKQLSLALGAAEMGVWRLDVVNQSRYFDDQVCRCLGIDPARFCGTTEEFYAAVHPDDRDRLAITLQATIENDAPYEVEYRAVWPDGSIHHIAARGRLSRNAAAPALMLDGLVWDITERKQAEERLQASLNEKEVMLKEIHHRVKNNLQVISSLVSLQADGSQDETVRDVLRDVTYRVRSMALVHEKLYQSSDLGHIDFAEYTRGLLGYLWRAHGSTAASIRLTLDLQPLSLPVDTAVPCGLILNELAGNALKHAFQGRDSGEVTVSLHSPEAGQISLSVSDNGVGLPTGYDWRHTRSLGLRLVQMLSGQLNAGVEVGNDGEGTRFEILFRLRD